MCSCGLYKIGLWYCKIILNKPQISRFVLNLSSFYIALQFLRSKYAGSIYPKVFSPKTQLTLHRGQVVPQEHFFLRKLYFLNTKFQSHSDCSQGCTTSSNICTCFSWKHYYHGLTLSKILKWVVPVFTLSKTHPTLPYLCFKTQIIKLQI